MTIVASPCPQAAHTWNIHAGSIHTHTLSLPCRAGLLAGPGIGQPLGGQGAASVTTFCRCSPEDTLTSVLSWSKGREI